MQATTVVDRSFIKHKLLPALQSSEAFQLTGALESVISEMSGDLPDPNAGKVGRCCLGVGLKILIDSGDLDSGDLDSSEPSSDTSIGPVRRTETEGAERILKNNSMPSDAHLAMMGIFPESRDSGDEGFPDDDDPRIFVTDLVVLNDEFYVPGHPFVAVIEYLDGRVSSEVGHSESWTRATTAAFRAMRAFATSVVAASPE